jgi:uncharacterized protein (DUF1697 family)
MAKYAAFLRGINVGGRTLKMAEVKAFFRELGYSAVATYLQSGNVVFDAESPSVVEIEAAMTGRFAYPAKVLLVTFDALSEAISNCPFEDDPAYHRYLVFFKDGLEREFVSSAVGLDPAIESLKLGVGVVYWRVRVGMTLDTPVAKLLTKPKYKDFHTSRNIRTVAKMVT